MVIEFIKNAVKPKVVKPSDKEHLNRKNPRIIKLFHISSFTGAGNSDHSIILFRALVMDFNSWVQMPINTMKKMYCFLISAIFQKIYKGSM